MTAQEILDELKSLGNEATKKVLLKHGAREPFFGVKVEDLKKIQKRIKKDYIEKVRQRGAIGKKRKTAKC
jgi:hypothetical protein